MGGFTLTTINGREFSITVDEYNRYMTIWDNPDKIFKFMNGGKIIVLPIRNVAYLAMDSHYGRQMDQSIDVTGIPQSGTGYVDPMSGNMGYGVSPGYDYGPAVPPPGPQFNPDGTRRW